MVSKLLHQIFPLSPFSRDRWIIKELNFYLSTSSSASGGAAGVLFNWPETSPAPRHRTLGVALALGLSGFPPHLLLHVAALLGDGRIPSIVPCYLARAWCWGRRRGNCGRVKVCKDTRSKTRHFWKTFTRPQFPLFHGSFFSTYQCQLGSLVSKILLQSLL